MADLLVQHLQEKGKEHSALAMLVNQWGFDEKLIPKALQTIGSLFPHYSRHDESHSKQILINIERLLGENIKLLTATDTWLLLEAAYWHDIGMVVPQSDLDAALRDDDFKQYVEGIRNSPHHELHNFCISFDLRNIPHCLNGATTPIQAADQLRQLMAEWFRRQHSHRANTIVQSPWAAAGIQSPRTELIPARLFKILGQICQMHGAPFSYVLAENGLPFREAGLAQEDCHPRFVACLLRMGDLLDLDDNRFCPVMQRIAGENRPALTKAHEDKHSAIRHLRIDREYIEIDAECDSIDGYVEAFKWFDWLKQEMQDQMANWQRIVPSRELGLLPTLGKITVRLSGKLQILTEGDRPQFTIDTDRAKELLQGSNLYNDQYACVRELLQNAVDATLLRLWLVEGNSGDLSEWSTPLSGKAEQLLKSTPVKIALTENSTPSEEGRSNWTLSITDEGTGISREDLLHMLKIGGSQRNLERQKKINSMPEWMKPSGVFGIGFQSAFLLSDVVTITTKSIFSSEVLQIEMHSPTADKEGLVLLQQLDGDIFHPYGTTLTLNFSLSKEHQLHVRKNAENTIAQRVAWAYDPILDEPVAIAAANLADKIYQFARYSPVEIVGTMQTADGKHSVAIKEKGADDRSSLGAWRFLKLNGYQLKIRYKPSRDESSRRNEKVSFYYRGQEFNARVNVQFVELEVDLLSGKAGSWLNASRDAIAVKAQRTFSKLVLDALEEVVSIDLRNPESCEWMKEENRPEFSFFLQKMAHRHHGEWESLAGKLGDRWADLPSFDKANSLRYYLNKEELLVRIDTYGYFQEAGDKFDLRMDYDVGDLFLRKWVEGAQKTLSIRDQAEINGREELYGRCYSLKSEPQVPYTDAALAMNLARLSQTAFSNSRHTLRFFDNRWSALFLREDVEINASAIFSFKASEGGRVLLPFLFRASNHESHRASVEVPSIDELCAWVKPKLIRKLDLIEIKLEYEKLISYIDEDLMRTSRYQAKWFAQRR